MLDIFDKNSISIDSEKGIVILYENEDMFISMKLYDKILKNLKDVLKKEQQVFNDLKNFLTKIENEHKDFNKKNLPFLNNTSDYVDNLHSDIKATITSYIDILEKSSSNKPSFDDVEKLFKNNLSFISKNFVKGLYGKVIKKEYVYINAFKFKHFCWNITTFLNDDILDVLHPSYINEMEEILDKVKTKLTQENKTKSFWVRLLDR